MRVEIWTDIICPWCGLGHHQLQKALARFEHANDVELVYRSYQLDENAPMDKTDSVAEMLQRKKGWPLAEVRQATARVESLAAEAGLVPYHVFDNQVGNTSRAHELAMWSGEQGKGAEIWHALYQSYFGARRSIFTVDALVELASEHGLDAKQARIVLHDRRYRDRVRAERREAMQLGANGVPFVVVDRRYGVAGAQSEDAFLEVLRRAWTNTKARAPHAGEGCDTDVNG